MLNVIHTPEMDAVQVAGTEYSLAEVEAMQRAIVKLFAHWGVADLDASIILGGISVKTFRRWKTGELGRVNRDLADRMSNLLAIHKALRIVFSDPGIGYGWIGASNEVFNGRSALDIMRNGGMEDIVRIRRYLDSVRGGW